MSARVHVRAALLSVLVAAPPALAEPAAESAEALAIRALDDGILAAGNATAEVVLAVSKDGKVVRERRLLTRIRREAGRTRALLEFRAPADVAGTRFLSLEEPGGTEQYVYLPAFKKVKRVVGAQKSASFMGTDFAYADLEGREPRDHAWRRLPDEAVGGQPCTVLEGRPKAPTPDGYGRSVIWVHRDKGVPMQMELFAADGTTLVKRFSVRRLEKKGERWLATEAVMSTVGKDTETRLTLVSIDFSTVIPDAELTRAALER